MELLIVLSVQNADRNFFFLIIYRVINDDCTLETGPGLGAWPLAWLGDLAAKTEKHHVLTLTHSI